MDSRVLTRVRRLRCLTLVFRLPILRVTPPHRLMVLVPIRLPLLWPPLRKLPARL